MEMQRIAQLAIVYPYIHQSHPDWVRTYWQLTIEALATRKDPLLKQDWR